MYPGSLFFTLFFVIITQTLCQAHDTREIIQLLNHDIEQTHNSKEKSSLHICRARQYYKIKEWNKALKDYNDALELNHKAWIHLERSHFLISMGKYESAYEDATAAKEEVPTLASEADKVIEVAVAEIRKKYEAENPVTIIMDTKVDPYRKTRFDIMKERGVGMFAANAGIRTNSGRKKRKRKKQKSSCKPKARS